MSRKEESRTMATLTTSKLCSNSLASRQPVNGKVECWRRDMRKIAAAKAGNMAIPFQREFSSYIAGSIAAHAGWAIK
jgi:hypothetical protein